MKFISYLKTKYSYSHYPFLLIIFFVLHQWRLFFNIVSFVDVIQVLLILLILSATLFLICSIILKPFWKIAFVNFIVIFLLLFTNSLLTGLKLWTIISRLDIQLIIMGIISILAIVLMRKIEQIFISLTQFLNIVLTVFILLEIGLLFFERKTYTRGAASSFEIASNVKSGDSLPSVFLLVFDEYAGSESLKRNFNYDNKHLVNSLYDRQFKVIEDAFSNYQFTALSIPSMFNGNYILTSKGQTPYGEMAFRKCVFDMYYNDTYTLFKRLGYTTFNYSPFEIDKNPAAYKSTFLPMDVSLLLYSTLIDDLAGRLPLKLLKVFGRETWIESYYKQISKEQGKVVNDLIYTSKQKKNNPVFCYMHLMLPHGPYLYDSLGRINTDYVKKISPSIVEQKKAYIQSVGYANKLMISVIDALKENTSGKAVIIVISDHGYKTHTFQDRNSDKFNSFNAIYFPGEEDRWYDSMSNVNQLRILFSAITGENIPLLKDSLVLK